VTWNVCERIRVSLVDGGRVRKIYYADIEPSGEWRVLVDPQDLELDSPKVLIYAVPVSQGAQDREFAVSSGSPVSASVEIRRP